MAAVTRFVHVRHKDPIALEQERELLIVCSPMRSHVNLSRIIRMAACVGLKEVIAIGQGKVDKKIARDGADNVEVKVKRSLVPVLKKLGEQGYTRVGLEQTTNSHILADYEFPRKTALIIGSEREGLSAEALEHVDAVVEIPVYGLPYSYNAATATIIAIYEYCRQYPKG
ncbi:MAG: TrmH family RNA methyltransferase [Planctomycetota bacterium]|nr:TrmH family RNA methyltransferase [Planctomycetota bacterium]